MAARLSSRERERFLRGRHMAVLVTLNADGNPTPTPVWYLYRDGVFRFRTAGNAVKTKNIWRDPRVSICVQDERPPYKAVIVWGRVEITEAEDWLSREIPRRYLGAIGAIAYRRAARSRIERGPNIALNVRPESFTTIDFTPETPWFGRVWLLMKRVLPPWL
jgi:PPOX class probable F420-dependent enzyme